MNLSFQLTKSKVKMLLLIRAMFCGMLMVLPACQIPKLRGPEAGPQLPSGYDFPRATEDTYKGNVYSQDKASQDKSSDSDKDASKDSSDSSSAPEKEKNKDAKDSKDTEKPPGEKPANKDGPIPDSSASSGPGILPNLNAVATNMPDTSAPKPAPRAAQSVRGGISNPNPSSGVVQVAYRQDPGNPDKNAEKSTEKDVPKKTDPGKDTGDDKDPEKLSTPKTAEEAEKDGKNNPGKSNSMAPTNKDGTPLVAVNTADNTARLGYEEYYKDPVLTALIHQALVTNRELKILDQEYLIANNEVLARKGTYLPFVTGGGGIGLEKPSLYTPVGAVERQLEVLPGVHFPNPLWNFQLGLDVTWQLDIWRQLRNARDAAQQRYIAAGDRRNYFVTKLIAEIAENYYKLMALDNRMETIDSTIALQEKSLKVAIAKKEAGEDTLLPVQRFQAEVSKNKSEKLIIRQEIIEVENKINYLLNRYPQPVIRPSQAFLDLNIQALTVGLPSQLLQNRADIRQAERELAATGLDVKVARARFYPTVSIDGGAGFEAFNPRYLFNPDAIIAGVAGSMVAPLINKKAIQADYLTANAKQLQAVYNYQRVVLNAFTEVINRVSMVENYRRSIELKRQQLKSLEESVDSASKLFQNAKVDYIDVLFAQRDMMEARMVLIETKKEQLAAAVNAYQALGGGNAVPLPIPDAPPSLLHKDTWNISQNWSWFHDLNWFHSSTDKQ